MPPMGLSVLLLMAMMMAMMMTMFIMVVIMTLVKEAPVWLDFSAVIVL